MVHYAGGISWWELLSITNRHMVTIPEHVAVNLPINKGIGPLVRTKIDHGFTIVLESTKVRSEPVLAHARVSVCLSVCLYTCLAVHLSVCLGVSMYVYLERHLIDYGDLNTKVRISFIVLATLWGPKTKQ